MTSRGQKLKTVYRPSATLEVFYTGGAVCASGQGLVACACSDEIKVIAIRSASSVCLTMYVSRTYRCINCMSRRLGSTSFQYFPRSEPESRFCSDLLPRQLVEPATSSVTRTLPGDTEPVTALAFSPSGNRLYSASRSLQQHCWDVSNGAAVRSWKGHRGPVLAMAVDPSGGLLASASADRSCRVWDTEGFYCTHAFHGHKCASDFISIIGEQ
jgi:WD40 repeat protein